MTEEKKSNEHNQDFVVMPVYCSLCRQNARDGLGEYFVRSDGHGIVCPACNRQVKMMKTQNHFGARSPAQLARQKHRNHGKYAKVNPCYVCGKSAGVDYFSHPDTDNTINDELLVLCKKCSDWLSQYDGKTAIELAFRKRGGDNDV